MVGRAAKRNRQVEQALKPGLIRSNRTAYSIANIAEAEVAGVADGEPR